MPNGIFYFSPYGEPHDVWSGDITVFRNVLLTGAEYVEHEGRTVLMFPHDVLDHRVNVIRRAEGTPAVPVPPVWYDLETSVIRTIHASPYAKEALFWLRLNMDDAKEALMVHRGDLAQPIKDLVNPQRVGQPGPYTAWYGEHLRLNLQASRRRAIEKGERDFPFWSPLLYTVEPDGSIWRGTGRGWFRVVQAYEEI